jgi:hypothetical protein
MYNHNRLMKRRNEGASECPTNYESSSSGSKLPVKAVPRIYEVVIECRHEAEQRAVFERMRGEGYRCRLMTL